MRTFLVIAALAALAACSQQPAALTGDALVQRGEYLVTAIGGCNDCHTTMTPQGPDMAHSLQGSPLSFAPTVEIPWAATAPQIAGGPAGWTEEQFETFLQTGVRPDGSHPLPPMPPYRFNAEDAHAVAAYIATLPRAE